MTQQMRTAAAVHRRISQSIVRSQHDVEYAIVRQTEPRFIVELFTSHLQLVEGEDFFLSDLLRWWHNMYEIQKDDRVVLYEVSQANWLAFDVRCTRDLAHGIDPTARPRTLITDNGTVKQLMNAYDREGNKLGVVLVYDETTLVDSPFRDFVQSGASDPTWTLDGSAGPIAISGTATPDKHITRKVPVYDDDNNLLGYVPIYSSL